MGLRINTNVSSLNAQRSLSRATEALNTSFRRLSTGQRVATAADDAAGLAISERLRARIRSTEQASRNAQDGISLVQTAEGAMQESNSMLVRMRELAVQANNGTMSTADRDTLNAEFNALITEIDRVAAATNFNTINLLDGTVASLTLQVGADTTAGVDTLNVSMTSATAVALGINALNIGSTGDASAAIAAIDTAINNISQGRGSLGAVQNRLQGLIANLQVSVENLSAAESRIRDVDVAAETAALTKHSIIQQAAISVLAQANTQPQSALALLQG
jgi:flagellin